MSAISEARQRFKEQRPQFVLAAKRVETEIRSLVGSHGLDCQVSGRAKEVASFASKCLRKEYTDPWNQVTDKVGVRIIVSDSNNIAAVVNLLSERYETVRIENKDEELREHEQIGYGGVHMQIRLEADAETTGGECEIQVRTAAQNVWSEMSHKLLYKPGVEPDAETQRALLRLAVLMEIFDEEVRRRVKLIVSSAGYPIQELINTAEAQFYRFADVKYDRALSMIILSEIAETLPGDLSPGYDTRLLTFADAHEVKLAGIFDRYRDSDSSQLVHQPEAIIIFERLEADRHTFRAVWEDRLPTDELDILEAIWGG
ncbi:GTP pyrophosphokinase [Mycobacterium sp. BMJ-28]